MNVEDILEGISKLSVLVVGDVCLDKWTFYDPALSEPSRETGIPRIAVTGARCTPGAAGTIACNAVGLGAGRVAVFGMIGDDGHGHDLIAGLRQRRIETDWLVVSEVEQTFTYTKLINHDTGIEDLPRVDYVYDFLSRNTVQKLRDTFFQSWEEFDVILVSDQAETPGGGVVTGDIRQQLAALGEERNVWVDSRKRIEEFRGVYLKPNEDEAQAALKRCKLADYRGLLELTESPQLVITHGPKGVLLVDREGETWVPTHGVETPVDICGAGDSFAAGMALAYQVTGKMGEAARFGNLVASITIMKKGTGCIDVPLEVLLAAERRW